MAKRGGRQHIPRPPSARLGSEPVWAQGDPKRRYRLAEVAAAARSLPQLEPHLAMPPSTRPAAVLMAFFEADGEARVILTKRPDTMASHQGEIAFPGGKFDPDLDVDLVATALREAHEEVGLDPASVDVVAEMPSRVTVAGRFLLTPFVGLINARPALHPDPVEVVSVFDVSISELLDDEVYREERWDIPANLGLGPEVGLDRPIHFFELPGETVWGATARILADFLAHLVTATPA